MDTFTLTDIRFAGAYNNYRVVEANTLLSGRYYLIVPGNFRGYNRVNEIPQCWIKAVRYGKGKYPKTGIKYCAELGIDIEVSTNLLMNNRNAWRTWELYLEAITPKLEEYGVNMYTFVCSAPFAPWNECQYTDNLATNPDGASPPSFSGIVDECYPILKYYDYLVFRGFSNAQALQQVWKMYNERKEMK